MSLKEKNNKSVEDFNRAQRHAFLLLKYRARSKSEITGRLKFKKFSAKVIARVIKFLEENNYINDREFTREHIAAAIERGWGPRRIKFALNKLGIPAILGDELLPGRDAYNEKLTALAKKKISTLKGKKGAYSKVVRFLLSRGFDYDEIYRTMDELRV